MLLDSLCFYKLHPLLFSFAYRSVEAFRVTPQPRERVQVPILPRKVDITEIFVTILGSILHLVVKDSNLVSVNNRDVCLAELRQGRVVKVPVRVSEEAETLAYAGTFATRFARFCFALAAL